MRLIIACKSFDDSKRIFKSLTKNFPGNSIVHNPSYWEFRGSNLIITALTLCISQTCGMRADLLITDCDEDSKKREIAKLMLNVGGSIVKVNETIYKMGKLRSFCTK